MAIRTESKSCSGIRMEVNMKPYVKKKAAMCAGIGKKRMTDALRACDYCSTSVDERSACYKAVAREEGLRTKTCMMM